MKAWLEKNREKSVLPGRMSPIHSRLWCSQYNRCTERERECSESIEKNEERECSESIEKNRGCSECIERRTQRERRVESSEHRERKSSRTEIERGERERERAVG